jgi:hypothetical protein
MPFQIKGLINLHIKPFFQKTTYIYESSQISILKTILPENTYLLFLRWNRCSHIIFHVHEENTNLHMYIKSFFKNHLNLSSLGCIHITYNQMLFEIMCELAHIYICIHILICKST